MSGEINIGDIRNILASSVIKSVLRNPRNGVIISSDADTFPTNECALKLHDHFKQFGSVYGPIDKKIEFDSSIPEDEQEKISQLFLLNDIHTILLDYFTSGRLGLSESMGAGGAGFFSTIDRFVEVSGYSSMEFSEDTDLVNKLYAQKPDDFKPITTQELTNTIRFSNRLGGDGDLLSKLRKSDYPSDHSLNKTKAHALFRRWFSNTIVNQLSFEKALNQLNLDQILDFLPENELGEFKKLAENFLADNVDNDESKIENFFQNILERLYAIKNDDLTTATKDYALFISNYFSKDKEFKNILSKNQTNNSLDLDNIVLHSFIEFVSNKDKITTHFPSI